MLMKLWSNRRWVPFVAGIVQNGTATFEDSFMVSSKKAKTKPKKPHTFTIKPSNHILWYLSKGVENVCLPVCTVLHRSWKQPICSSFAKWIKKLLYPDDGILFSTNMKWTINPGKEEPQIHITKCKEPIRKDYIFYNFNYTTFLKR